MAFNFLADHVKHACSRGLGGLSKTAFPSKVTDDAGVAAVIDISGFTALTSNLQKVHGNDGAARLRDLISAPFEKIIQKVVGTGGSVVKFAGDSAVVCWSDTDESVPNRRQLIVQAFACCLDLLLSFQPGKVSPPARSGLDGADADDIGIHIGLGFGALHHIYIGENGTRPLRRDYLVAGPSVQEAGEILNISKRGDLAVSRSFMANLTAAMEALRVVDVGLSSIAIAEHAAAFVMNGSDAALARVLSRLKQHQLHAEKLESPRSAEEWNAALTFIDESVAKTLGPWSDDYADEQRASPPHRAHAWEDALKLYSDMRNVTVAFIRFLDIDLNDPADLARAQRAFLATVRTVRTFGGCLRQFNMDDKGFTALVVWGLKGFAHERNESKYALQAMLSVRLELSRLSIGAFRVGVAAGKVYAGLIGGNLRMDGTVLGSAVNYAARLMCVPTPESCILVDGVAQTSCESDFVFSRLNGIKLKGFAEVSDSFVLVEETTNKRTKAQELVGREQELSDIRRVVERWTQENETSCRIFISGRSGFGKSALLRHTAEHLVSSPYVIVTSTVGDETRKKTSMVAFGNFLRNFVLSLVDANVPPSTSSTSQEARKSFQEGLMESKASLGDADSDVGASPVSRYMMDLVKAMRLPALECKILAGVPGLGVNSGREALNLSPAEYSSRLASIVTTLVDRLEERSFRCVFVWDDIQWLDQVSFGTLYNMLRWCKSVFFLLGGRPREEWSNHTFFDTIVSSESMSCIALNPMSHEDVRNLIRRLWENQIPLEDDVVLDVYNKSQGVPIAVGMIIRLESRRYGTKVFRKGRNFAVSENTGTALDGTISAQMDSLSEDFQELVRVAAVCGQYFDLETVTGVFRVVKRSEEDFRKRLLRLIEEEDRYGFFKLLNRDSASYSFCHYLVHQGVLASMLPRTKDELNRAVVTHYEGLLTRSDPSLVLPLLIQHLIKLDGEQGKKERYLFDGFVLAAEKSKIEEALSYSRDLFRVSPSYYKTLPLEAHLRFLHLLGAVHKESGEAALTEDICVEGCLAAGFRIPLSTKQPGNLLATIARLGFFLHTLRSQPGKKQACMAILSKIFPKAFPAWRKVKRNFKKGQLRVSPAEQHSITPTEREILEELINLVDLLLRTTFVGRAGLDLFLHAQLLLILYTLSDKFVSWRTKFGHFLLGFLYRSAFLRYEHFFAVSDPIQQEPESFREELYELDYLLLEQTGRVLFGERNTLPSLAMCCRALDKASRLGVEYDTEVKLGWLAVGTALQELGHFSLYVEDVHFSIESLVEIFRMKCPKEAYITQMETFMAPYHAVHCDFEKAKEYFFKLSDFHLDGVAQGSEDNSLSFVSCCANMVRAGCVLLEWEHECEEAVNYLTKIEALVQEAIHCIRNMGPAAASTFTSPAQLLCSTFAGLGLFLAEKNLLHANRYHTLKAAIPKLLDTISRTSFLLTHRLYKKVKLGQYTRSARLLWHGRAANRRPRLSAFVAAAERLLRTHDDGLTEYQVVALRAHAWRARRILGDGADDDDGRAIVGDLERFDIPWEAKCVERLLGGGGGGMEASRKG